MIALLLYRTVADHLLPLGLKLAAKLLSRSLNMPEPLLHSTGDYVVAQVVTFEHGVAKSLCPFRLVRLLRAWAHPVLKSHVQPRRMTMIHASTFLRRALLADAVFSGVSALGLTFGAGAFASLFNLPEGLLRESGLFLIAYTALVGGLASRNAVPKALVMLVVAGNVAWTLASIALLFSGAVTPNIIGEFTVVAQAIATGVFAELQYIGLRRSGGAVAA